MCVERIQEEAMRLRLTSSAVPAFLAAGYTELVDEMCIENEKSSKRMVGK
jgi:hypothetical protein